MMKHRVEAVRIREGFAILNNMKEFDKIVRYLNEVKSYNLEIKKDKTFRFVNIPIKRFTEVGSSTRYVIFDEHMGLGGQVDDVAIAHNIITSAKSEINKGFTKCEQCISDGGGCGHIDRDELFYLFCDE